MQTSEIKFTHLIDLFFVDLFCIVPFAKKKRHNPKMCPAHAYDGVQTNTSQDVPYNGMYAHSDYKIRLYSVFVPRS